MFLVLILLSVFAQATQDFEIVRGHGLHEDLGGHSLHIDLDYREYGVLLDTEILFTSKDEYVEKSIQAGQRTLAWLEHINSSLSEEKQWDFYPKGKLRGIPITAPKRYSLERIKKSYKKIQKELPSEMASVIFKNGKFKDIDKKTFLSFGKKIISYYQTAVRWKSLSPYLSSYAAQRKRDIRGYYFLSQMKDVKNQLKSWNSLSVEQKEIFSSHLKSICFNTRGVASDCERELKEASNRGSVYAFYEKYIHKAQKVYNSFFDFYHKRRDILWSDPHTAFLPFQEIDNQRQRNFFTENVEDEWQWGDWKLKIQFQAGAQASLIFSPSVVASVSGGNRIVMDSNSSLDSWGAQWTIRHELGHVLGFRDCYIEFYEEETGDMVNYQIDTDNLMCSRSGKLSQIHYDTLKRHYFRP